METSDYLFIFVYAFVVVRVLMSNDKLIQNIKKRYEQVISSQGLEDSLSKRGSMLTLDIEEFTTHLSKASKHLLLVIIFGSIGMGMFYTFFNGSTSVILICITVLYVFSQCSVRQNIVKYRTKIKQLQC